MRNEDSSPISTLKVVATARTGKETDTFHIFGHFLFYLQQKQNREKITFLNVSYVHKNKQFKQLLYLRVKSQQAVLDYGLNDSSQTEVYSSLCYCDLKSSATHWISYTSRH